MRLPKPDPIREEALAMDRLRMRLFVWVSWLNIPVGPVLGVMARIKLDGHRIAENIVPTGYLLVSAYMIYWYLEAPAYPPERRKAVVWLMSGGYNGLTMAAYAWSFMPGRMLCHWLEARDYVVPALVSIPLFLHGLAMVASVAQAMFQLRMLRAMREDAARLAAAEGSVQPFVADAD